MNHRPTPLTELELMLLRSGWPPLPERSARPAPAPRPEPLRRALRLARTLLRAATRPDAAGGETSPDA